MNTLPVKMSMKNAFLDYHIFTEYNLTIGHSRVTIGYLKATLVHIRVTLGHLKVFDHLFEYHSPQPAPTLLQQ